MRFGIEPLGAVGLGPEARGDCTFGEAKWEDGSDGVERWLSWQASDGVRFEFLNGVA